MRKIIFAVALVALAAASASTAFAQASTRQGFYVSVGGAYGSVDLKGDQGDQLSDLSSSLKSGFAGYLAFGGTLSPKFRLGFEDDVFWSSATVSSTKFNYNTMMYSGVLAFYPSETNNFHAKLYLGYINATLNQDIGHEGGFAWGLGVGYDWTIAQGGLVLVPFVNYFDQASGTKFSNDDSSNPEKFKASGWLIGIGIGYHH
ncbi:MAG TPA: outer membrane beta-barrel protein [Gemmatimonadaceae bacterium]|nr:outer membrane beta-barrel protein [Gemmatimonadaceae bacterium]